MGQQGTNNFNYPQLTSLSRYNKVTGVYYDPETELSDRPNTDPVRIQPIRNPVIRDPAKEIIYPDTYDTDMGLNLLDMSINDFSSNLINTWQDIGHDVMNRKFNKILSVNNRLCYVGVSIIILVLVFALIF
jgi:hypothetical protein